MAAKLYKFPDVGKAHPQQENVVEATDPLIHSSPPLLHRIVHIVWLMLVLVWPISKWLFALDVLFQFIRAMYYHNTPGMYAGLTAMIHASLLIAITYFVEFYGPRKF